MSWISLFRWNSRDQQGFPWERLLLKENPYDAVRNSLEKLLLSGKRQKGVCMSNTHLCGCGSGGALFFRPPMLRTLLVSHAVWCCSFPHYRTEPAAKGAVGFIQHHLNWIEWKCALCICSSSWAAKGKSGEPWNHIWRGWAHHHTPCEASSSDTPSLQGGVGMWCDMWRVAVTSKEKDWLNLCRRVTLGKYLGTELN